MSEIADIKTDINELMLRTDSLLTIVAFMVDGELLTSSDPKIVALREILRSHRNDIEEYALCSKQDSSLQ